MNKISIWCNRLSRRQEKVIIPEIEKLEKKQRSTRRKIHQQVVRRQPIAIKTRSLLWTLRGCNVRWPRVKVSFMQLDFTLKRTKRNVEKTAHALNDVVQKNSDKRVTVEALNGQISNLQGMFDRDYHQRLVNCQVTMKVARALKRAFGVPEDFCNVHWPVKGAVQGGAPGDPNSMTSHMTHVLEIAQASTAKAIYTPVNALPLEKANLFRSVPVSLQKFST